MSTQDSPQHWLDIMPAIPLTRAVPIRRLSAGESVAQEPRIVLSVCMRTDHVSGTEELYADLDNGAPGTCSPWPVRLCRVDLDDPQGFGYALRLCLAGDSSGAWDAVLWRHLRGETTDADRLAIAYVLAEEAP